MVNFVCFVYFIEITVTDLTVRRIEPGLMNENTQY